MASFATSSMRSAAGLDVIWQPPASQPGPAPTPTNFEIVKVTPVRSGSATLYVTKLRYPGCINHEGFKVIVSEFNPIDRFSIDPHFLPGNGILARFEPNKRGWEWAIRAAEIMVKDYL